MNKVYGWISATRLPSYQARRGFRLHAALVVGALLANGCGGGREGGTPATGGAGGQSGSPGNAGVSGTAGTSGTSGTGGGGVAGAGGTEAGRGGASGAGGLAAGTGGTASGGGGGGSAGSGIAGGRGGSSGTSGVGGGRGGTTGAAGRGGASGAVGAAGSGGGGAAGAAGGSAGRGGSGGSLVVNKVFNSCRFHFGALENAARATTLTPQIDIFTPGWMGQKDTFDMMGVCTATAAGGPLAGKVPVIVAYVAAFYAKRHFGRCDCNVSAMRHNNVLCHNGVADIQQNLTSILNVYKSYAQGFASCYGTTKPIIFEMELDWYQYTITEQTQAMTEAQAGTIMGQFVDAIRQVFRTHSSRWTSRRGWEVTAPTTGRRLVLALRHEEVDLHQHVGWGTDVDVEKIRAANLMTWAGVSPVTSKPILRRHRLRSERQLGGPRCELGQPGEHQRPDRRRRRRYHAVQPNRHRGDDDRQRPGSANDAGELPVRDSAALACTRVARLATSPAPCRQSAAGRPRFRSSNVAMNLTMG